MIIQPATTTNDNKNVCPTGWHVPTDAEWTVLTNYLGGQGIAGGKMKEVGTASWNSPNMESNNVSLFTGLSGGVRSNHGSYESIGNGGVWWSSMDYNAISAWHLSLGSSNGGVGRYHDKKGGGLSIRCLKD